MITQIELKLQAETSFRVGLALCHRHNLAGPESGPRARWAQKVNVINL
jgi:hypothetical protein